MRSFNLFDNGVRSLGMDRVSILMQPEGRVWEVHQRYRQTCKRGFPQVGGTPAWWLLLVHSVQSLKWFTLQNQERFAGDSTGFRGQLKAATGRNVIEPGLVWRALGSSVRLFMLSWAFVCRVR